MAVSIFFITGGTGFLGRNLLKSMGEEKLNVFTPKRNEIFSFLSKQGNVDLFIHAAGKAHSTKSTKRESDEFFNVNLELTRRITKQIDEQGLKLNTFVFISTVAVYGLEEGLDISEGAPLNGNSPYSQSKKWLRHIFRNGRKRVALI